MTDKFSAAQFTAKTLSEALPYIQRYVGQIVVVKYGGHAMVDESLSAMFARDVVLLKTLGIHPVIVHGGGPQIGKLLDRLGIVSEFKGGLRVTDEATMEVVEMVLSGPINKSIVLSGSDGQLLQATKATKTERDPDSHIEQVLDLGFVGEPTGVDTSVIEALLQADSQLIPVVAPVAMGPDGHRFNVNADIAAGALAEALGASRLLLLTDVAGVLDKDKNLMRDIKVGTIPGLIEDGTAVGGMIPKLETAAHSVNHGVGAAVILDGRAPHALLMELFTEHGAGTLIS